MLRFPALLLAAFLPAIPWHDACAREATPPPLKDSADSRAEHVAWLKECLRDIRELRPGCLRREVMHKFDYRGGFRVGSTIVLHYKKCPMIAVAAASISEHEA